MFVAKIKSAFVGQTSVKTVRSVQEINGIAIKLFARDTASDYFKQLAVISERGTLSHAAIDAISDRVIEELSNQARKFERSGELASSFVLEWHPGGYAEVTSDLPYSLTWARPDNQGVPVVWRLLDWMQYVPDFSELDYSEKRSIAWAIRKSFIDGTGAGSTGKSVLRRLDPVGERYFDYIQAAIDQIQPEIEQMGAAMRSL